MQRGGLVETPAGHRRKIGRSLVLFSSTPRRPVPRGDVISPGADSRTHALCPVERPAADRCEIVRRGVAYTAADGGAIAGSDVKLAAAHDLRTLAVDGVICTGDDPAVATVEVSGPDHQIVGAGLDTWKRAGEIARGIDISLVVTDDEVEQMINRLESVTRRRLAVSRCSPAELVVEGLAEIGRGDSGYSPG